MTKRELGLEGKKDGLPTPGERKHYAHMKILLAILLSATAATQTLFAQTTTLTMPTNGTQNQNVTVPAGQVFQMLTFSSSYASVIVNGVSASGGSGLVVAGPATVSIAQGGGASLVCTYKLYVDTQTANQNVASQAVVIPSNATANSDIIFESSPDLVNWTAAVAGSYAPTTANRFFRVRLVTH